MQVLNYLLILVSESIIGNFVQIWYGSSGQMLKLLNGHKNVKCVNMHKYQEHKNSLYYFFSVSYDCIIPHECFLVQRYAMFKNEN